MEGGKTPESKISPSAAAVESEIPDAPIDHAVRTMDGIIRFSHDQIVADVGGGEAIGAWLAHDKIRKVAIDAPEKQLRGGTEIESAGSIERGEDVFVGDSYRLRSAIRCLLDCCESEKGVLNRRIDLVCVSLRCESEGEEFPTECCCRESEFRRRFPSQ